jgi:hypothetical protein
VLVVRIFSAQEVSFYPFKRAACDRDLRGEAIVIDVDTGLKQAYGTVCLEDEGKIIFCARLKELEIGKKEQRRKEEIERAELTWGFGSHSTECGE